MVFERRNTTIELTYQIGYDDNRLTSRALSVFRRKRTEAVCGFEGTKYGGWNLDPQFSFRELWKDSLNSWETWSPFASFQDQTVNPSFFYISRVCRRSKTTTKSSPTVFVDTTKESSFKPRLLGILAQIKKKSLSRQRNKEPTIHIKPVTISTSSLTFKHTVTKYFISLKILHAVTWQ